MKQKAVPQADPRVESGPFGKLLADIRKCKEDRKCPCLRSRRYYFEPNPVTANEWQALGVFVAGVDCRVVFVCESPGPRIPSKGGAEPLRCWAGGGRNERFREALKEYDLANCYITNTVKCGPRRRGRHTDDEIDACRKFLARELNLLRPLVAVGVGGNAYRTLRAHVLPILKYRPVLFQITHYSARGGDAWLWSKWKSEFGELERLLRRLKPESER